MENLLLGLQELADPQVLLFILIGGVVGLLAGAIPGLNDTNILTLFLSFVVFLDPFPAVILMTAPFPRFSSISPAHPPPRLPRLRAIS